MQTEPQTGGRSSEPRNVSRTHVIGVPKAERTRRDPFRDHAVEMLTEAKELGLAGATDFEAAEHFNVQVSTINYWKQRYPEFAEALRIGKDIADGIVAATLYHKARGYTFQSEEIKVVEGVIVRVPTKTHVPPDTTAMIFWLKNRQRDQWRDVQTLEGGVTVKVEQGDVRVLALALLATIQAGLASPVIEGTVNQEHVKNDVHE